jgi:hypothetical protein
MSQPTPAAAPSVSWRRRALRRTAGSLGAAVVISGIAPAVANAAGAHVVNPMAFALRTSGDAVSNMLGLDQTDATDTTSACASATPTATESSAPVESETPSESAAPSESVEPTDSVDPSASVEPSESVAASESPETTESVEATASDQPTESVEPTEVEPSESVEPAESVEPSDDGCDDASESPSAEPTESEAADDHGQIVSTVAHCAPHGKDPLLAVDGAPAHHGGYVSVAAHGETLTTPWGTFDLSTQAGADELCAALAAARDALPAPTAAPKAHGKHSKPAKTEHGHVRHGKPANAGSHGKGHGKHATSDAASNGTGDGTDEADSTESDSDGGTD